MRKDKYPSKETVNLAAQESALQNLDRILPICFLSLILAVFILLVCVIWPLKRLNHARSDLREMEEELGRYQEYNKDYEQTEKAYRQYFATYLTEEEEALVSRAQVIKLLKEKSEAYGTVESLELRDNTCRMILKEIPVSSILQLSKELESSLLISQVTVSTAEAREGGKDKGQTVTADLTIILEGQDTDSHLTDPDEAQAGYMEVIP